MKGNLVKILKALDFIKCVSIEEIDKAMASINHDTCPDIDGFNAKFLRNVGPMSSQMCMMQCSIFLLGKQS